MKTKRNSQDKRLLLVLVVVALVLWGVYAWRTYLKQPSGESKLVDPVQVQE